MKKYLYVMDPLQNINPDGDTTFDFMLESQTRGIQNYICEINELWSRADKGYAFAHKASVFRPQVTGAAHCTIEDGEDICFDDFAVIWMRKDPPIDEAFNLSTVILDRHDPKKTLMMNSPKGLRIADEKLWALFAPELGPETIVSSRPSVLKAAVQEFDTGVVKAIGFAGGSGVMVFHKDDKNLNAALDLLTQEGSRPAVVQRYIKDVTSGDKRVILLGGEPIGALLRIPHSSDHRANMHVGGSVAQGILDENDYKIAARLKPELLKLGLHFVGIDVIGGLLTEVNVTSPTGIQEIDLLDGRIDHQKLSSQVMDYVEALIKTI